MSSMESIRSAILDAYGTIDRPDFHFVGREASNGRYDHLVGALSQRFEIEDLTDPNSDVGRLVRLQRGPAEWFLWLSYVGPYAALLKPVSGTRQDVRPSPSTSEERQIFDECWANGLVLLDRETLATPVQLALQNTAPERVNVFNALFSDVDIPPWERVRD